MRSALLVLLLACGSARAAEPIFGFNFPDWSRDGYAGRASQDQLKALAGTGAGWVALTPTLFVRDRRDSTVAPSPNTPSDDSLRSSIRAAHALGLKVALKPHVDSMQGGARAWLEPKDAAAWFEGYDRYMLAYARLAREEHCELFVVGTELALLTTPNHWGSWRKLIAAVRAEYSGPITYAANWHSAELVGFWRDVDFIGIDAYYPVDGGTNRTILAIGWLPVEAALKVLSMVNGKPVLFTEFGLASQKGANMRPWDYTDFGPLDQEVQDAYVDTFLRAFAGKKFVAGFLNWAWDQNPGGPADKSMSIKGKPALATFQKFFPAAPKAAEYVAPPHAAAAEKAAAVMAAAPALSGQ